MFRKLFNAFRRSRICEKLDRVHGGSWYYDPNTDRYCDYMTDRAVAAKDVR